MPIHLPTITRRQFVPGAAGAIGSFVLVQKGYPRDVGGSNRFALVSDTHIMADPAATARGINMADHLRQVVGAITRLDTQPAHVIVNGDLKNMSDDPITLWIEQLRHADNLAAQNLWRHFMGRLVATARARLQAKTRRVYDEEDAALSAFRSFCIGISNGQFPDIEDRNNLIRLLLVITARKVSRRHEHDHRVRRDIDRDGTNCIFAASDTPGFQEQSVALNPTPNSRMQESSAAVPFSQKQRHKAGGGP